MNSKIKILLVENNDNRRLTLLRYFGENKYFEIDGVDNINEAMRQLDNKSYRILLTDLHLESKEDDPSYEGLTLGQMAKERFRDIVIVMYSMHLDNKEERMDLERNCIKHGADAVYSRSELLNLLPQELKSVYGQILKKRYSIEHEYIEIGKDLRTGALVEVVGEETLISLIRSSLKNATQITFMAHQAGFSGALLGRLTSKLANGSSSDNIIKISQSQFSLEDELQRRPFEGTTLSSVAVSSIPDTIATQNGWTCVLIPFVKNMILLKDFLSSTDKEVPYEDTLEKMVSSLLVGPAQDAFMLKDVKARLDQSDRVGAEITKKTIWDNYKLTKVAAYELTEVVGRLKELNGLLTSDQMIDIQSVAIFLEEVITGNWTFSLDKFMVANLHGDFHSRNIFVGADRDPKLIDFGRADLYPRLFDFACLQVDIFMSIIDSTNGREHQFANIPGWVDKCSKYYPISPISAIKGLFDNSKVEFLLEQINLQMLSTVIGISEREYAESLLFHLLRFLRFPVVSLPKKVLACQLIPLLLRKID